MTLADDKTIAAAAIRPDGESPKNRQSPSAAMGAPMTL